MHLCRVTLEKFAASYIQPVSNAHLLYLNTKGALSFKSFRTTDEKSVAGENGLASRILHVIADTILRVARGVHSRDGNITNLELLLVFWRLGDPLAVLAANDGELLSAQFRQLWIYVS
jgi:hypothetical protein